MTFFVIAALMVLAAAGTLALPLWRGRVRAAAGLVAANRAVHAARLTELELDVEAGRLSHDDYASARRDLEMDLAAGAAAGSPPRVRAQRWVAAATLIVLMLLSGGLYWFYGSWRAGAEGVDAASRRAVLDMVDRLAQRLHTSQGANDLQGWDMLGHSYMIMGRYPDALDAFSHARQLSNDQDPQELAGYAEALTLSDQTAFMDKALPLFEKVLRMHPTNVQALWYGGLGALQQGDKDLAIRRWNAILAQNPPADYRAYIEKAISDAGGVPATSGPTISVHVAVSATLMKTVAADETVFVYALPKNETAGSPLAVRKFKAQDLPADLEFSDQDAVMPGRNLSSTDDIVITARISKSGDAIPQAGDLIGQAEWRKQAPQALTITINAVVK